MAAAVEGIRFIKTGVLVSLSAQELLDCVEGAKCHGGGEWSLTAYQFILKYGLTTEQIYPYTGVKGKCEWNKVYSPAVKIQGFSYVPPDNETELMKAVARQPISASLNASPNFEVYQGGVFQSQCGILPNHYITIVGYGETSDGIQYWLIKNSWGVEWGEGGHIRLLRGYHERAGKCGIAIGGSYPIFNLKNHAYVS